MSDSGDQTNVCLIRFLSPVWLCKVINRRRLFSSSPRLPQSKKKRRTIMGKKMAFMARDRERRKNG
jgi:hypothetical protein